MWFTGTLLNLLTVLAGGLVFAFAAPSLNTAAWPG